MKDADQVRATLQAGTSRDAGAAARRHGGVQAKRPLRKHTAWSGRILARRKRPRPVCCAPSKREQFQGDQA